MAVDADPTVEPAVWRDRRKPLWPLALLVPALPFVGFALWRAGGGAWAWWLTPAIVFGLIPVVDLLLGDDRQNLPRRPCPGWRPTATTAGSPTSTCRRSTRHWCCAARCGPTTASPSRVPPAWWPPSGWSTASPSTRLTSWATNASGWSGGCPRWPWRRPPTGISTSSTTAATTYASPRRRIRRARDWGGLLGVLAAYRPRQPALGLAGGDQPVPHSRPVPVDPPQRRAQRVGPDPGAVRGADPGLRPGGAAVPGPAGGGRLLPAGGGQLSGALRAGPAAHRRRTLREGRRPAQLEQRPHGHQRLPLPAPAAQRPSREPAAPLPDAAPLRHLTAAARRVRDDGGRGAGPAAVATGDGPPGAGALRRRSGLANTRPRR